MHTFVTGGSGLIGSAVISELLSNGHSVSALARSETSARSLSTAGATPVRGRLTDLDVLREAAAKADGVIHLAFSNDFSSPESVAYAVAEEGAALAVLGETLTNSERPIVAVAGTPVTPGRASTESDPLDTGGPVGGRAASVAALLARASQGVRCAVVRLPRTVHRDGDGGFAGILTQMARRRGEVAYPGDGSQRWPAVHALDAATLFRRVLEDAPAGTSWHAVADEGDAVADIAGVIATRLGLPLVSRPADRFGPLGAIFSADQPASSTLTQSSLSWTPTHLSLLKDLEKIQPIESAPAARL